MKFINRIDKNIGLENVVFVMSSDHGVGPLPEYLRSIGIESERLDQPAFKEKIKNIKEWSENKIAYTGGGFYFPIDYTQKQKSDALIKITKELSDLKAIKKLMTRDEILSLEGNDPFSRRMRNMIHPDKSPDVIIVIKEFYSEKHPLGATHGTPYDYDTHVPIIFSHQSIKSQKINHAVSTVDIAPTIARLVGAPFPKEVNGHILNEIVK
jgi:arylsulfatase A-like enzyme